MKSDKGITLVTLVIYIVLMCIVMIILGVIVNEFYNNTNTIQADTKEVLEFNKFNTYFLKEIKAVDNKVDNIKDNYILFASGNSFSLLNNKIYYNDIIICEGVNEFVVKQGIKGEENNENVVYVILKFNNFEKSMNYKIEDIY